MTAFTAPDGVGISFGNVVSVVAPVAAVDGAVAVDAFPAAGDLYVEPPAEYFDFPSDVFDDDGNYVLKAWAEDDDGTRISPVASIELGVQEGDPVGTVAIGSTYAGYAVTAATVDTPRSVLVSRAWGGATE